MYSFNQFCYFPLIYSFKHLEIYSFIHLGSSLYFLPLFTDPVSFFFSFLFLVSLVTQSCTTLVYGPCPLDFSGKSTGVDCCFLLWGIFQTQGRNQHLLYLLHDRQILDPLSHQGNPVIQLIISN